nr:MAG TPA: hypothetical protein [Caudoviricetes sp.]DAL20167.1 MAG TPA_asm: hypothetical protein [Caudoviricetes sp.]
MLTAMINIISPYGELAFRFSTAYWAWNIKR